MALLRESQAVQPGMVRDTRQMAQTQIGAANIQPNYTRQIGIADDGSSARWKQGLLENLLGVAVKAGDQYINNELNDAYLSGSAQAAIGKSEAELETNPFTAKWATAGFRDNMGRLTQAKQDAQLQQDMAWLRERPPAEMAEYLAKNRAELMPVLNGMSGEMRTKMIPMMALRDQSAVSIHKSEHQKHIWDVTGKAMTVPISSGIEELTTMKLKGESGPAYLDKTDTVVASIIDMNTSNIPTAQKQVLIQEAVELALTNKHVALYDALRHAKVPDSIDAQGNMRSSNGLSLLQSLPVPMQQKLAAQFQTAWDSEKIIATQQIHDNTNLMENELKSGLTEKWDEPTFMRQLDLATRSGMPQGRREKLLDVFYDAHHTKRNSLRDLQAGLTGDTGYIYGPDGKGLSETNKAVYKGIAHKPIPEQINDLTKAVTVYGNVELAKGIAERIQPSIMSLSVKDGKLTQESAMNLQQFHATLDSLKDQPNATQILMEGLSPDAQLRVERLRALNRNGITGEAAVTKMLDVEKQHAALSTNEKAILAESALKNDNKFLDDIGGQGMLSSIGTRIASLWSRDAELRRSIEGDKAPQAPAANSAAAESDFYNALHNEVRVEARELALIGHNGSSPEASKSRMEAAFANVMKRTVKLGTNSIIVVPKGETPHSYFGALPGTPPEMIDRAVSDHFKAETPGGFVSTTVTPRGIQWTEYDKNYLMVPGRTGFTDPKSLAPAIQRAKAPQRRRIDEMIGGGITYNAGDIKFSYNGVNTAGADQQAMLALRKNLIQNEGVKNKPYEDLSGKLDKNGNRIMTVGVGVSSHNPAYPKDAIRPDGTIPNEAIASSFREATNWAANEAVTMQRKIGISNSASFQLFAEMTYQGKANFQPFAIALKSGDKEQALEALRNVSAYKASADPKKPNVKTRRQMHYENLTIAALKG